MIVIHHQISAEVSIPLGTGEENGWGCLDDRGGSGALCLVALMASIHASMICESPSFANLSSMHVYWSPGDKTREFILGAC